jgi:hypothetical protein
MILALFALLITVRLGLLPYIRVGDYEPVNYVTHVTMPKDLLSKSFDALLAQEKVEWLLRWIVALIPAILIHPLALLPALLWANIPIGRRLLNYVGRAAEAEVAGQWGNPKYLELEIPFMKSAPIYKGAFRNLSNDDIVRNIHRARPVARILLWFCQVR